MTKRPNLTSLLLLLLLILCGSLKSSSLPPPSPPFDLISDGVQDHDLVESNTYISTNKLSMREESACEETYGFLPCSTTVLGNLFLIGVYCYITFFAANYVAKGSDLLLEIVGPGIIGGMVLPAVRVFPDAMLILVSGLSGSTEIAQSKVSVGMGLLAGSTIMLLTTIWGSCIFVGKHDIQRSIARYSNNNTERFSWTRSGVITNIFTSYAARIMAISILPFIIVQLPQLLNSSLERHIAILVALIFSVVQFVAYCLYQVAQPRIQKAHLAYARHRHVIAGILRHLNSHALGKLLNENDEPNVEAIKKLFNRIDENGDGRLSAAELRALTIGIHFGNIDIDIGNDDILEKMMNDFDTSRDSYIDVHEFVVGVSKWLDEAKRHLGGHHKYDASAASGTQSPTLITAFHVKTEQDHKLLWGSDQSEGEEEGVENAKWETLKAILMLISGTVVVSMFADPLVDSVDRFSDATNIPTFFISFIALPLATNPDAVFTVKLATEKKIKSASLSCSEIFWTVTMKNVLCLSVFLGLVYFRGLTWDFSSEVLVILLVCMLMGLFCSFRTIFPLWASLVAFLLYPFSLALVYVLQYCFGWS